jgi:hypothetical protein
MNRKPPRFGDPVFYMTLLALIGIGAISLVLTWRIATRPGSPPEVGAEVNPGDSKHP